MSTPNIRALTSNQTTANDENNWTVPSNFLPRYKGGITYKFAMDMKPWAPAFDNQKFASLARVDNSDKSLEKSWHNYMMNLYDEIQEMGQYATNQQALTLFRDEFNIVHPTTKARPTLIRDVFDIIENKKWYDSDRQRAHTCIYMMMYGMFRSGFDNWITDAASLWLRNKKITPYETNKIRVGKNFVYNVMVAKPSHNIQRAMRSACYRAHGEYIVCKIPKKKDEKVEMKYTEIGTNRWKAYLAQPIDCAAPQHKN